MNKYHMNAVCAFEAVCDSYLSDVLKKDPNYVIHDTVEYWAEFIYKELDL